MRGLYTGLAVWNLLVLAATAVLGFLTGPDGPVEPQVHRLLGFFAAIFGCLVQSILVTHFIGSMKWIQQTGPTAGLDDTRELRRAWIKGRLFPLLIASMLTTVAAAILGGGAGGGGLALVAHIVASLAVFPLNLVALRAARAAIPENRARMQAVERLALERQAQGLVPVTETDALRPESGRAGGKVFLFLAANVWVLFVYRRFILRLRAEPWWPYAVASLLLALLGLMLLRRWSERRPAEPATPR